MANDASASSINIDNAGFYPSYALITYIIDVIQPQTYVRLFPLTFNTFDQEYTVKNSFGVSVTRVKRIVLQTFVAQTCSDGVYTTSCSSGVEEISIVMFRNEIFYNLGSDNEIDYSTFNEIYTQEVDYIPDPTTSAVLVAGTDNALVSGTVSIICNVAQNNVLSQTDWNLRTDTLQVNSDGSVGTNQMIQICGSPANVTGTFGINRVGSDGFTLGAKVF